MITVIATTITIPITIGTSRPPAALTAKDPMPGHVKTVSVITAPAIISGRCKPTTLITGRSAFLNA
jgi:hypothetical protein